jgi:hypothetical protein
MKNIIFISERNSDFVVIWSGRDELQLVDTCSSGRAIGTCQFVQYFSSESRSFEIRHNVKSKLVYNTSEFHNRVT